MAFVPTPAKMSQRMPRRQLDVVSAVHAIAAGRRAFVHAHASTKTCLRYTPGHMRLHSMFFYVLILAEGFFFFFFMYSSLPLPRHRWQNTSMKELFCSFVSKTVNGGSCSAHVHERCPRDASTPEGVEATRGA